MLPLSNGVVNSWCWMSKMYIYLFINQAVILLKEGGGGISIYLYTNYWTYEEDWWNIDLTISLISISSIRLISPIVGFPFFITNCVFDLDLLSSNSSYLVNWSIWWSRCCSLTRGTSLKVSLACWQSTKILFHPFEVIPNIVLFDH